MATYKLKRKYYSEDEEKSNSGLIIGGGLGALAGGTVGAVLKNNQDLIVKDTDKSYVLCH